MSPSREAADTPKRRAWALLALALCAALPACPAAAPAPRAAEPARLAARSLLIAIAPAGERLVAVGDRGVIVLSDDGGVSWTQADSVPVDVLLTGVCFLDAQHGVAVGHDEVVLLTADAGRSWKLTHYAPQAERPLLDVWCGNAGRVIAVGAYRAYLVSRDGGLNFSAGEFAPRSRAAVRSGASAADQEAGGGDHLNRIVGAAGERLYIAAEAGHLYRSDDGGGSWQELASPYDGSFFDVLPLTGEAVLAFGLRGNLFRSEDAGASWQRLPTGTVAMLDGGTRLGGEAVAIVGFSGVLLLSRDGGRSFTLAQQSDRSGLSAALAAGPGRLAVVGEAGARRIALGASR